MSVRVLIPHLVVNDAAAALKFYAEAFGATEVGRMPNPDGKIMHSELRLGGYRLYVNDEFPQSSIKAPTTLGATTVALALEFDDPVAAAQQAIAAGATEIMPVAKQFWGALYGQVRDPYGYVWAFAESAPQA